MTIRSRLVKVFFFFNIFLLTTYAIVTNYFTITFTLTFLEFLLIVRFATVFWHLTAILLSLVTIVLELDFLIIAVRDCAKKPFNYRYESRKHRNCNSLKFGIFCNVTCYLHKNFLSKFKLAPITIFFYNNDPMIKCDYFLILMIIEGTSFFFKDLRRAQQL